MHRYLDFLCALWPTADIALRDRNEIREAVTARLIHQVPCKDGGVLFIQPVVDGVTPVDHNINVVFEELLHIWICEEWVMAFSSCPLNVLHHMPK